MLGPTSSLSSSSSTSTLKHEVLVFNDVTLEVLNLDDLALMVEDIVLDVRFASMV